MSQTAYPGSTRAGGSSAPLVRMWRARRAHGTGKRPEFGLLAVIALGGALGALARYGLDAAIPHRGGGFPLSTFLVNVTGCFVIGAFTVSITELLTVHRLVQPFFGVGVLGGYTTFSTYVVDTLRLVRAGDTTTALLYLFGTLGASLVAVVLGIVASRAAPRLLGRVAGGERRSGRSRDGRP